LFRRCGATLMVSHLLLPEQKEKATNISVDGLY
jgi:hypothetical protein